MAIRTMKTGTMEYFTAAGIAVPHGFTTRRGGVSTGMFDSLNLTHHRGDTPEHVEQNHILLAQALGYDIKRLVMCRQTHSDIVRAVTADDAMGINHHAYPECDGLITNTPGVALMVCTADCTPILLWDEETGAVGAVHAGWRGTAAGIAGKAVKVMAEHFGCDPVNIHAAIGPNIGPCCFETDADVPMAMRETYGEAAEEWIRLSGKKFYLNLKALNALSLRQAGVQKIEISDQCTACKPDFLWSHRVTGGQRGSQGAVIVCGGGEA